MASYVTDLDAEQLAALRRYAAAHGRNWKLKLLGH